MAKKLFYSMGEVSEMFDVNPSLIRHWGKERSKSARLHVKMEHLFQQTGFSQDM